MAERPLPAPARAATTAPATATAPAPTEPEPRSSKALPTRRARRRLRAVIAVLVAACAVIVGLSLTYDNPMPVGSEGFWLIGRLRAQNLLVIAVVALAQGTATVAFQTVTTNRILTPSIMGFESLYRLVQTTAVFVLGAGGVAATGSLWAFVAQIALMVVFATVLYGWLFAGRRGNLQITLLVGIILGSGLNAAATFMQRLLTPSEFDVLTARLVGSIANAQVSYLVVSVPLVLIVCGVLWARSRTLDVLALGPQTAVNIGVDHRRETLLVLVLTAALMAVSTALVGPMTFFGFLVAMVAYQLADTYDHRHVLATAALTGFVVLAGAHLVLKHVFYAEGAVGIIIELVGGIFFLAVLLRKGRL